MRVLDLFSGIGGFSLGLERAGMRTVAFCEIDPWAQAILRDKFPQREIFGDCREFSYAGERIDLVTAGFPCQDASVGNVTGLGAGGERTGLYREAIRIAGELGCPILMENVPGLLVRGFGDVLRDLAEIGFDAEWECISAREVGAPHLRERLWILAYPSSEGREGFESYRGVLGRVREEIAKHGNAAFEQWGSLVAGEFPLRSGDGLSLGMERRRLHGIGNAVVPQIPEIIGRAILSAAPSH